MESQHYEIILTIKFSDSEIQSLIKLRPAWSVTKPDAWSSDTRDANFQTSYQKSSFPSTY